MFSNVHIVLVNTSHPGNIGSTARAMKTMGFKKLLLVNPKEFPSVKSDALAVGCIDVLEKAKVFSSLDDAVASANVNIGLSVRTRKASIPTLNVNECINHVLSNNNLKYNIIFGNESSGLSNSDLLKCDYIVSIPTHKDYSSLNLSAAVQLITYEFYKHSNTHISNKKKPIVRATAKEKNYFIESLIALMGQTKFMSVKNSKSLTKKIYILFNKANLESDEVNMLLGMLNSINKKLNK